MNNDIMEPVIIKRPFNVTEYYRMAEAGILTEDDRLELIEGEIITMSPIGDRHMVCVNRLTRLLSTLAGQVAIVSVQNPLRLDEYSEPEPDIVLFKFREDFYATIPATPDDVLLVVEVADTSITYDRRVKLPLYAKAGIPELWLVDLQNESIDVYTHPVQSRYSQIRIVQRGESFALSVMVDVMIEAETILGPEPPLFNNPNQLMLNLPDDVKNPLEFDRNTNESDDDYFAFVKALEDLTVAELLQADGDDEQIRHTVRRYFVRGLRANLTVIELWDFFGISRNILDRVNLDDEKYDRLFDEACAEAIKEFEQS